MKNKEKKVSKNPLDFFFALGDKVTKGDPKRKADFDWYMLWLIFLAFFSIFIGNIWNFIQTQSIVSIGWACVMVGILWFQYNGLKQFYGTRKMMKEQEGKPQPELEIESEKDMLEEFKGGE